MFGRIELNFNLTEIYLWVSWIELVKDLFSAYFIWMTKTEK